MEKLIFFLISIWVYRINRINDFSEIDICEEMDKCIFSVKHLFSITKVSLKLEDRLSANTELKCGEWQTERLRNIERMSLEFLNSWDLS